MTPPEIRPARRSRWLLPILAIALLVGALACGTVLFVGLRGYVRVSRDTQTLRNGLLKSSAAGCDKTIELSVGALTLGLVRAGLAFVDMPPEARAALRAVRGVEVGVYRLGGSHRAIDRAVMLSAADQAMSARGWDRVVGVVDERELVAVYLPRTLRTPRDVRFCVAVLDDRELVLTSARSNLEPLLGMAFGRAWCKTRRLPIHLSAALK